MANKIICISCNEEVFDDDLKLCTDCDKECCGNCCAGGLCDNCIDAALYYDADEGAEDTDDL